MEQDLLIGLALSGKENSARIAVDVAVLCASVGRALGLSILSVADLATAAILHSVGQAYPNPDPNQIGPHQADPRLPFVSLLRGQLFETLVRRVIAAVEWRESVGLPGAVDDIGMNSDRHP